MSDNDVPHTRTNNTDLGVLIQNFLFYLTDSVKEDKEMNPNDYI